MGSFASMTEAFVPRLKFTNLFFGRHRKDTKRCLPRDGMPAVQRYSRFIWSKTKTLLLEEKKEEDYR